MAAEVTDDLVIPAWVSDEKLAEMNEQAVGWVGPNGRQVKFVRMADLDGSEHALEIVGWFKCCDHCGCRTRSRIGHDDSCRFGCNDD